MYNTLAGWAVLIEGFVRGNHMYIDDDPGRKNKQEVNEFHNLVMLVNTLLSMGRKAI